MLYLNTRPKLTLGVNVCLSAVGMQIQALNKDVVSFSQHALKQWHYSKTVKMEHAVLPSSIAIVAGTKCGAEGSFTGAPEEIKSQFPAQKVHLFCRNTSYKEDVNKEGMTVKSKQLRQNFTRCLSLEFEIHIKLEQYQNQLSVKAIRATST